MSAEVKPKKSELNENGAHDLGVREEALGHDFGCAELVSTDKDVYVRPVFCQIFEWQVSKMSDMKNVGAYK